MTNRVTPYAGGWLTFLIRQGICNEAEAREAQGRVAQAAIDELEARRAAAKKKKRKKKPEEE
jgi:hypothetical protein